MKRFFLTEGLRECYPYILGLHDAIENTPAAYDH